MTILNLGDMAWKPVPGFSISALRPIRRGRARPQSNGYFRAEAAQEGFLVLSGECVAVIENEERRMRRWDYFHSPAGTEHITVGAATSCA